MFFENSVSASLEITPVNMGFVKPLTTVDQVNILVVVLATASVITVFAMLLRRWWPAFNSFIPNLDLFSREHWTGDKEIVIFRGTDAFSSFFR